MTRRYGDIRKNAVPVLTPFASPCKRAKDPDSWAEGSRKARSIRAGALEVSMEPPASGEGNPIYVEIVPYEMYPESDWNLVADLLEAQFESELGIGD